MKNRIPKERVIYNNYDVTELYDYAKEYLIEQHKEEYPDDKDYEPSDNEVWEEYYFQDKFILKKNNNFSTFI